MDKSINELEKIALEYRPELQQSRYQQRISEAEVKTAMLEMLPGINLTAGYDYNSNQYLLNNSWASYGASVSWNLLNVFNAPLKNRVAKTKIELAKQQKLALSMAVISQVHLAMLNFYQSKKEYPLNKKNDSVYTTAAIETGGAIQVDSVYLIDKTYPTVKMEFTVRR